MNNLGSKFTLFFICIMLLGCNVSLVRETIANRVLPLPTASPSYKILSIRRSLISADSDCKLPCFMGLKAGETSLSDLEKSLVRVQNTPFILTYFDGGVTYNTSLSQKENGSLLAGFTARNDHLDSISLILSRSSDWLPKNIFLLSNVLDVLGEPDNVYVAIAGPPLSFTMVVVYNRAGVMIRYQAYFKEWVAKQLENTDDPFLICLVPNLVDVNSLYVWLVNPKSGNLVETQLPDLHDDKHETRPFWSIEKMVGINEQQFTRFFIDNPQGCLEAPSLK